MTAEKLLDIIEEFEAEWYAEHDSVYTDNHHAEFRAAKESYVEEYMQAEAEARAAFIEEYENRPETQYGWYQQDMIDMRRMER